MSEQNLDTNTNNKDSLTTEKKKKDESLKGIMILNKPARKLPELIEEILEKGIPVRLTKKGYLVGGFYGLGDDENKGFATAQETDRAAMVFFDNKGREHIIETFEDLVKFHNFVWGVFFKLSEDYKKPNVMWFHHMLQHGVVSITPGSNK